MLLLELKQKKRPTKVGGAPKLKVGALIWVLLLELLQANIDWHDPLVGPRHGHCPCRAKILHGHHMHRCAPHVPPGGPCIIVVAVPVRPFRVAARWAMPRGLVAAMACGAMHCGWSCVNPYPMSSSHILVMAVMAFFSVLCV